jgi:hypothetical protein
MQYDVSRELMKETIDSILAGDMQPRNRIDLLPGRINPVDMPRTGASSAPISDPSYDFKDWLGQVRGDYLARAEGEGRFPQVVAEDENS